MTPRTNNNHLLKVEYFLNHNYQILKVDCFHYVVFVSPRRHVVLLSELSRCVQQDCTCDEGDAMVYYIEAYRLVSRQACGEKQCEGMMCGEMQLEGAFDEGNARVY